MKWTNIAAVVFSLKKHRNGNDRQVLKELSCKFCV